MLEMQEKLYKDEGRRYGICEGRLSRKGEGVIWNSGITLQQLVGTWNTSVTADGGMSNEMMVLKQDGTGLFAEANMGPYWVTEINWYVEEDVLTITSDSDTICNAPIVYIPDAVIPCMSNEEKHFTVLKSGAHGLEYRRAIQNYTLEEWATDAECAYQMMKKEGIRGWGNEDD